MNTSATSNYAAMASAGNAAAANRIGALEQGKSHEQQLKAAKEFEAMFVSQMMQHMFTDIPTDGPFGGGHGEEMFRSLLIDEYGKTVAKKGGFGIADMMMSTLIKQQEVTP